MEILLYPNVYVLNIMLFGVLLFGLSDANDMDYLQNVCYYFWRL